MSSTIKPVDRERYTRELMKALDRAEELQQEKADFLATHKASLESLKTAITHWRNLLAGRKGEQLELSEDDDEGKGGKH